MGRKHRRRPDLVDFLDDQEARDDERLTEECAEFEEVFDEENDDR